MSGFIYTSAGGLAYAQAGATTSGNVTAQIAPQGTSLNALNKTTNPSMKCWTYSEHGCCGPSPISHQSFLCILVSFK